MDIHISSRALRLILLIVGLVGLLTVAFGVYTMLDANTRIDALTQLIQTTARVTPAPDAEVPAAGMNPMTGALMAIDRDREEQIARRGQSASIIGFGAIILGGAVLILLRVSEAAPQTGKSRRA
ncbi:MAG: hypothetical protein IT324_14100 [Anaerolineae bacterium]|nr:hypothetical protein [Anaerolineae bacterium]